MTHYGPRRKFPECPVILAGTFGVMDHAHIHIWAYIPKIVSSLLKVVESPDFTQSVCLIKGYNFLLYDFVVR